MHAIIPIPAIRYCFLLRPNAVTHTARGIAVTSPVGPLNGSSAAHEPATRHSANPGSLRDATAARKTQSRRSDIEYAM